MPIDLTQELSKKSISRVFFVTFRSLEWFYLQLALYRYRRGSFLLASSVAEFDEWRGFQG